MKRALLSLLLFAGALPAVQVYRVDPSPVMTISGSSPSGGFASLYAVPNASIAVYTDAAATIPATAYTDGTGNTACGVSAPVVQAGTALCSQTTNPQGAFGFWLAGGTYYFTITTQAGQRYGPYPITTGTLGIGTIALANGGTSAALVAAAGGIVYSTASQLAISTPGQLEYVANSIGGKEMIFGGAGAGPSSLAVQGSFSVPFVNADFGATNTAVGSDSTVTRSVAYINNGTGLTIGSENHVIKNSPAAVGQILAVVAGVHSDVVGNGSLDNVGIYLDSSHINWVTSGSGVRNDTGIVIQGADGWTHGLIYYDTNATILMDVDQYGNIRNRSGYLTTGGQNNSGVYPPYGTSNGCWGWNFSSGGGEMDAFNCQSIGTNKGFSWYQQTGASAATLLASLNGLTGTFAPLLYGSQTNCSSSASPAVCAAAPAGSAVIAAGGPVTVVVNTTAVTANSQIVVVEDSGLGAKLSVTCNTQALTTLGAPRITARTAGVSFTVGIDVSPTTNPMCLSYWVIN